MSHCPDCAKKAKETDDQRKQTVIERARKEAKAMGYDTFVLVPTKNRNPAYMWRPTDHPDCERLGIVGHYIV